MSVIRTLSRWFTGFPDSFSRAYFRENSQVWYFSKKSVKVERHTYRVIGPSLLSRLPLKIREYCHHRYLLFFLLLRPFSTFTPHVGHAWKILQVVAPLLTRTSSSFPKSLLLRARVRAIGPSIYAGEKIPQNLVRMYAFERVKREMFFLPW